MAPNARMLRLVLIGKVSSRLYSSVKAERQKNPLQSATGQETVGER